MKRWYGLLLIFLSLTVQEIDAQIEDLQELKRKHEARALRYDDQGQRWQFQQNQMQEARMAFEKADEERLKAAEIQLQIDELQK
jgi:hypothetical protein